MKYIKNLMALLVIVSIAGCSPDDDKFTGSPVGNLEIIELTGSVSTTAETVVAGQEFPVTVTIPQTFETDVEVEVVATVEGNQTTASILVEAGMTSGTGLIEAPAAAVGGIMPFNNPLNLRANAIVLDEVEPGVHYLLTSPSITIDFGDGTIPNPNITRLQIRLDWEGPYAADENDLDLLLFTGGGAYIRGSFTGTRYENTFVLNSQADGTYVIGVDTWTVATPGANIPWRMTLRYPDNSVQSFSGVFPNVNAGDLFVPVLNIVKTTNAEGLAEYSVSVAP